MAAIAAPDGMEKRPLVAGGASRGAARVAQQGRSRRIDRRKRVGGCAARTAGGHHRLDIAARERVRARLLVVVAVLRDERRPAGGHRVADAAVRRRPAAPRDEHGAGRAVLDGQRGSTEVRIAGVGVDVVDGERCPVRVVVDGAGQRPLRDDPRLGQRAIGDSVRGEDKGDRDRIALVREDERVPRRLLDGDVDERLPRDRCAEEALVVERLLLELDVDRVVGQGRAPLQQRRQDALRPDRLVVRVEPPEARVGRRCPLQDRLGRHGHRPARGRPADPTKPAGTACVDARVRTRRCSVVREPRRSP